VVGRDLDTGFFGPSHVSVTARELDMTGCVITKAQNNLDDEPDYTGICPNLQAGDAATGRPTSTQPARACVRSSAYVRNHTPTRQWRIFPGTKRRNPSQKCDGSPRRNSSEKCGGSPSEKCGGSPMAQAIMDLMVSKPSRCAGYRPPGIRRCPSGTRDQYKIARDGLAPRCEVGRIQRSPKSG
jgi:hypothetical protein